MFNDQRLTIDGETILGSSLQSTTYSEQLIINNQLLTVNFKNTSSGEEEYILPFCLSWVMVVLLSYFVSIVRLSSERNAERCLPVFFSEQSVKWPVENETAFSVRQLSIFNCQLKKKNLLTSIIYILKATLSGRVFSASSPPGLLLFSNQLTMKTIKYKNQE